MRIRVSAIAVLLLAATSSASAQQPTFPSRVELVTVDVVVFDRQGNPVQGLMRGDFTVREDGRPMEIAAFEAITVQPAPGPPARTQRVSTNDARPDAAGRWFFVVFDDVHITQFGTERTQDAIVQLIDGALRPGDHVMIAPSSGGSTWTGRLPEDREDLLAYVERLRGERRVETGADRIWDYEAMGITLGRDPQAQAQVARRYFENGLIQEAELSRSQDVRESFGDAAPGLQAIRIKARQTYTEATSRLRVSLGTLERMTAALSAARGRKTLLFLSEGFIMDTTLADFRTLVQAARNANVAIHYVDVRAPGGNVGKPGLPGASAEAGRAVQENDAIALGLAAREEEGTRSIAAETGGSVITGTNLLAGLTRVAAEGRSYYLLGYSPSNNRRDGRFRKIDVTVNRPGVTVRARGGYFEPTSEAAPPRSDPDKLAPEVRAGLDSPFGSPGLPIRVASYVFGAQADGKARTLLVAEADLRPLRLEQFLGAYSARLDSYVLVHDRSRNSLQRDERLVEVTLPPAVYEQTLRSGLPVQREFALEPGTYQATVLLRDGATGLIGSVRHEFEVPAVDSFHISTPVLTDVVQPGATPAAGRPVPVARRTFRAGTRLVSAFDIYGIQRDSTGAARVTLEYALRRSDGGQVTAGGPQALRPNAAGHFSAAIGLTLPAESAGDHDLLIRVRDEVAGRTIEDRESFIVEP